MGLQLSLDLPGHAEGPARLWILQTAPEHLDALRKVVSGSMAEALVDRLDGTSPISRQDAVLVRLAPGSYEGHGGSAAVAATAFNRRHDFSRTLVECLGDAAATVGTELLALWPGRPPASRNSAERQGALEDLLFHLGGRYRPSPSRRLQLCLRAVGHLDQRQALLRSLLVAQASNIAMALGSPSVPCDGAGQSRGPRLDRSYLGRVLAPRRRRGGKAAQLGLFDHGAGRTDRIGGLGAFRAWAIGFDIGGLDHGTGFARFTDGGARLVVDEGRLKQAIPPLFGREVAVVVKPGRWSGRERTIVVTMDWRLRHVFEGLIPDPSPNARLRLWVEDARGRSVTVAKPVDFGHQLEIPTDRLEIRDEVVGSAVFRSGGGLETRTPFVFRMSCS